jgi:type IV pilus assembly protein PilB
MTIGINSKIMDQVTSDMVREGIITPDQLAVARVSHDSLGDDISDILVQKGFVTEAQVLGFLGKYLSIPFVSLRKYPFDRELIKKVPLHLARRHHILPLRDEDNVVVVAMGDPLNLYALEDLRQLFDQEIHPVLVSCKEIDGAIDKLYGAGKSSKDISLEQIESVGSSEEDFRPALGKRLEEIATGPKVVQTVNEIIVQASQEGASDIHIEPRRDGLHIRNRIDGLLEERQVFDKEMHLPIVSRIKIISGMDIAERRVPQDGRFRLRIGGKAIDIRVSSYTTMQGEKVVLRLLSMGEVITVEDLGFSEKERKVFQDIVGRPHGIFLVTGPTGSGKSTTLYAALERLNSPEKNIVSIEDPIEREIVGVSQAQINPKAGVSFASALRAILRQDPDIIMLGEIRDRETAEIAIRAANTGHMVLSTLHTNRASGAITRLLDLGIESFFLSSALVGVMSQRLVRKICTSCRVGTPVPALASGKHLSRVPERAYRGKGCQQCRMTGYSGRVGIFELAPIRGKIRTCIDQGKSEGMIEEAMREMGVPAIEEDGLAKVEAGITTLDELLRVTREED